MLLPLVPTATDKSEIFVVEFKHRETLIYFIHTDARTTELKDRIYWPDVQCSVINQDYVIIPGNHSSHLSFYKDKSKIISTDLPSNTVSISYIDKRKIILIQETE